MTTDTAAQSGTVQAQTRSRRIRHFVRHYLEMVAAMLVGMTALGAVEGLVWPSVMARADVGAMVMATNMAVGMTAWMRFRGHGWRSIAEMDAAMYLPFVVLLVPFWAGLLSGGALLTAGHLLMLPAMAAVMLWHPCDYEG